MEEKELPPPEVIDDLYPPTKYVKVNLLRGLDVTLRIARVGRREIEDEKTGEPKIEGYVVFDKRPPNVLTINKTNGLCLSAMFGPKVGDWDGKRLTLMPARDRGLGGKIVDCVRLRGSPDISEPVSYTRKRRRAKPETFTAVPTAKKETEK
jgi:hypothetical protein